MATWAAIAISTLMILGALAAVFSKLNSRLTALETRINLDDDRKNDDQQAGKDRRHVEMAEHCRDCPAMREHKQWADNSKVRSNPLTSTAATAL